MRSRYKICKDQAVLFVDKASNTVVVVFPQDATQEQMLPHLTHQGKVTASHVLEWCESHNIPCKKLGYWTARRAIKYVNANNMQHGEERTYG